MINVQYYYELTRGRVPRVNRSLAAYSITMRLEADYDLRVLGTLLISFLYIILLCYVLIIVQQLFRYCGLWVLVHVLEIELVYQCIYTFLDYCCESNWTCEGRCRIKAVLTSSKLLYRSSRWFPRENNTWREEPRTPPRNGGLSVPCQTQEALLIVSFSLALLPHQSGLLKPTLHVYPVHYRQEGVSGAFLPYPDERRNREFPSQGNLCHRLAACCGLNRWHTYRMGERKKKIQKHDNFPAGFRGFQFILCYLESLTLRDPACVQASMYTTGTIYFLIKNESANCLWNLLC